MDRDTAKKLYHQYGTLLCLDAPCDGSLQFGIDTNSWQTGPQFKGVKLIPLGIHYIFYSLTSKYGGDPVLRTSFFYNFQRGDVIVVRWNAKLELFDFLSRDDASPYIRSVHEYEFDSGLGTYPHESKGHWLSLSQFITPGLISKLQPIGINITASGKALTDEEKRQLDEAMEEMGLEEETRQKELDNMREASECYFTRIPRATLPKGSLPSMITAINMDKTYVLEKMIEKEYEGKPNLLLGELQFAFICFLLGQSFEAFEQWKALVILTLNCETAMLQKNRLQFFLDLLVVLEKQLVEAPEDFFLDILSGNNFLHHSLSDFFEIVNDEKMPPELIEASEKFKYFVEERFGVPFQDTWMPSEE